MVDIFDRDDCRHLWGCRFAEPLTWRSEPAEASTAIDQANVEVAEARGEGGASGGARPRTIVYLAPARLLNLERDGGAAPETNFGASLHQMGKGLHHILICLLYTSPSPRD